MLSLGDTGPVSTKMRIMTLTLTLDAETEERLTARAQAVGADAGELAALLLADLLRSEQTILEAELTEAEWASLQAGLRRGEEDFAAGRIRSLDEIKLDKAKRFGIHPDPNDAEG
jgi:hypothetical protein